MGVRVEQWLLEQGGAWGVLIILLVAALVWQQKRIGTLGKMLDSERTGRLEDAKAYSRDLVEMSARVHQAIDLLARIKKNGNENGRP